MDYNWFFSSVAQSAAAIVGIFAAFIITKIINNQSTFAQNNIKLKQLINDAHGLEDAANRRYFNWYNRHTLDKALSRLQKELEDPANDLKTAEEYYTQFDFPLFLKKGKLLKLIESKMENRHRRSPSKYGLDGIGISIPTVPDFGLSKALEDEKEYINDVIDKIRHHNRLISTFIYGIEDHPESSTLISYSILATVLLFFAGVIYPLSFLPLETGKDISLSFVAFLEILLSLRGIILSAVSIIFTAILAIFAKINLKMKYNDEDISRLRFYSTIGSYSEYLDIMTLNSGPNDNEGDSQGASQADAEECAMEPLG